jgi:hypothetical protein
MVTGLCLVANAKTDDRPGISIAFFFFDEPYPDAE